MNKEKWTPSNNSDFMVFCVENCDNCSKESRCKHIKNSMVDGTPFELEDGKCAYLKPIGTPNRKRTFYNKGQIDFLEVIDEQA